MVDKTPLVAFLSSCDRHHLWGVNRFRELKPPLLTCEAVIVEAGCLLRRAHGGVNGPFALLDAGAGFVDFSPAQERAQVQRLLSRCKNVPMSIADACRVRMSELFAASRVFTIDRDFQVYRRNGRDAIPVLLP